VWVEVNTLPGRVDSKVQKRERRETRKSAEGKKVT
jgi:hypothetical protein